MSKQQHTGETTPHEKRTGKTLPGAMNNDCFTVRQALPTLQAAVEYDKYLKNWRRRLRQLERLARGELTPSSENYR